MHGMNLKTFAAGDVLMAEGAPGDSLYVLTTGTVKCWVRDSKGHYIKVQELPEGAFFGEISVLTGKPRTATLTAASYCEALELDKKTLDAITAKHPRVREVLKKFHEQRAVRHRRGHPQEAERAKLTFPYRLPTIDGGV